MVKRDPCQEVPPNKENAHFQTVQSNESDIQADPDQGQDQLIKNKDQMKTNEDHDQEVQPKSQPNLILTVDMVDQGQLIEEVPFEEMTRDVIIGKSSSKFISE